jgi:molecular chaperone GrpE
MDETETEIQDEVETPGEPGSGDRAGNEAGAVDAAGSPPGSDGGEGSGPTGTGGGDGRTPSGQDAARDTELQALREEFEDLNDRHLRLAAEFNNYRRRVDQERLDTWTRAQADLVGHLLDVLDDLQRVAGLDLTNATVDGIMEGIDLVERKFVRALQDAGAEILSPEPGTPFDPETMEAMMRVPVEDEAQDDTVAQVFQKGYAFKGRLVRPSRVGVHKHGG